MKKAASASIWSKHEWMFPTKTFKTLYGDGQGTTGTDDAFTRRGFENLGAWILGDARGASAG